MWPSRKPTGMCAFGDGPATAVVELRISEYQAGRKRGPYIAGATRVLCDKHARVYLELLKQGGGRANDERRTGVDRRDRP